MFVHQDAACRSCKPVYVVYKIHNSVLTVHTVHLATAYLGLKECAVTKEFCMYSLPVVSGVQLAQQFLYLNAN